VKGGQVDAQPPLQVLLPESAVSFLNM
jgi:hypothetical protein